MLKLKDIEKKLGASCWRTDNGQRLIIKACALGDNFYDYGEEEPEKIDYRFEPELENDPRILVLTCGGCCECSGW